MKTLLAVIALVVATSPAYAQSNNNTIGVRGFVTFGSVTFSAEDSFDAVLGSPSGPIFGGGGQVLLPWGLFVQVAASRFSADGERAFIGPAPEREVFRLGIPLEVTVTPLEVSGGWRLRRWDRVVPYGGGGFSSYRYKETSDFAESGDDIDDRFSGFHVLGGVEYLALPWMAVGGEVAWSSIADALAQGGVSAAFNEDNLGGTTLRLKISFGR